MGVSKEQYMDVVGAANDAASVVSEEIAATSGFHLPAFERAIVAPAELPEMLAEIVEGVLLETHKMLLTGPSKANKTWGAHQPGHLGSHRRLVDRLQVRPEESALHRPGDRPPHAAEAHIDRGHGQER